MAYRAQSFIGEKIEPYYREPQTFSKRPSCPNGFLWQGVDYEITESLKEWVDFSRRGRMGRNMSPQHSTAASRHGSWGVGRYHFHVRTANGQMVHIYYDRAPKDSDERGGEWFIVSYLSESPGDPEDPVDIN